MGGSPTCTTGCTRSNERRNAVAQKLSKKERNYAKISARPALPCAPVDDTILFFVRLLNNPQSELSFSVIGRKSPPS